MSLGLVLFIYSCSNNNGQKMTQQDTNYVFGKLKWEGKWITRDTTNLKYPCTLESTILTFFKTWDDSVTYEFKNIPDSNLANINHGTGMWLRNNYGLWGRTCVVHYFWDKGIFHPDDMSAILLTSYHRYLNAKPINVEEQIKMYKAFWKNEMHVEYKIADSAKWDFGPSMWDMGISNYKIKSK